MLPDNISLMVNNAIKDIRRSIPINAAYLRGSYARGKYSRDSDVDMVIVTNYLAKYSQEIRRKILMTCIDSYSKRMDFLCITLNELTEYSKRPLFQKEVMILLYSEGEQYDK